MTYGGEDNHLEIMECFNLTTILRRDVTPYKYMELNIAVMG